MNRSAIAPLLAASLLLLVAPPAWAGETVEGNGWSLVVPDGFSEVASLDGGGEFRVKANCRDLPIDGTPEMKVFTAGGSNMLPPAILMVMRVGLSRSVNSAKELGLDDLQSTRQQLPAGATVDVTKVGDFHAIETMAVQESLDADMMTRMLIVACDDYVVQVVLMTDEYAYPDSADMWTSLKDSIEIDPPMNKFILFGLIGLGALGGLWVLSRVGTRPIHEAPERTSRFQRPEGAYAGSAGALPGHPAARPPPLPGSPPQFDRSGSVPARVPTSPAVTRAPAPAPAPARPGLRSTLPASGRWGDK